MTFRRVVQLEFNEISRPIIEKLVSQGELPTFRRILADWTFHDTQSEFEYKNVEPWIQWVTVHTGKSFGDHGLFHLGEAATLRHPQIWEVLEEKGIASLIIGAMNARRGAIKSSIFFPDPWSKENEAFPDDLKPLWSLISARVQSHAVSQPTAAAFIQAFQTLRRYKVPFGIFAEIFAQIVRQRMQPLSKWRLAALFDRFQAELFISLIEDPKYRFCSLFLNAAAHYQHHFWRRFEPELFNASVGCPDCKDSDDPIRFGYRVYDDILRRVLAKIDLNETQVFLVSGLSQVPDTRHETDGGMNYYRLFDHRKFCSLFGIPNQSVFPMMSRDWQIRPQGSENRQTLCDTLAAITLEGGEPVFSVSLAAENDVFVETAVTRYLDGSQLIYLGDRVLGTFGEHFHRIAVKSGHHTHVGNFWSSSPVKGSQQGKSLALGSVFQAGISSLT